MFQNYYCFDEFMSMAKKHKDMYGNNFSYTLFDLSLKRKFIIKRTIFSLTLIAAISFIGYGVYILNKKN